MGEVFRARDTRLDRTVAIKILRRDAAQPPEARLRFEREARAVAQLAHPNICALYDVGSEGETDYIVMELLEGETLASRLQRGPLPLAEALRCGIEISEALAAAHRRGIVHRDLKPANVMLTRSGVKLLDFGLARAAMPAGVEASEAPTEQHPVTSDGMVVGTLAYMAPEQLEGKPVDARADIFALGAVLYESLTGRRAFAGPSAQSLMAAILGGEPPALVTLLPDVPPILDRLVATCLAKDPEKRWESAADLAHELRWIAGGMGDRPARAVEKAAPSRRWAFIGAGAVAVLLALATAFLLRHADRPAEATRFKILPPSGETMLGFVVLSPDARQLLLLLRDNAGKNALAVRSLDSLETRVLPGTENARGAFWSPDSREIAFFSDGKLQRMSAEGGPSSVVCDSGGAVWGAWGGDGTIVFTKEFTGPLLAVAAAGGAPRQISTPDPAHGDVWQSQPSFLPDGRHFLYLVSDGKSARRTIAVGSIDPGEKPRILFPSDTNAVFADPGYLLFARDDAVFAWRFDLRKLETIGEPFPAFENVHWAVWDNFLSLSAAGRRVAYMSWLPRRRLMWVDRKGRELGAVGEPGSYFDVRISPDGTKVAVATRDMAHGRNGDVWILDAARGTGLRLTPEPNDDFNPAWFADGERVLYVSERGRFYSIFERPAGGGPAKVVLQGDRDEMLPQVAVDQRHVLTSENTAGKESRMLTSLDDVAHPLRLGTDPSFSEEHGRLAPDGRFCAFDSIESGQREVYLEPVPNGPRRQVSVGGGQMPVWNRDGRELFYAARNGLLMSVAVRTEGGRIELGEPQPLFPLDFDISGELSWHLLPYDVAPDGQRFLVVRRMPGVEPDGAIVVSDWTAALPKSR